MPIDSMREMERTPISNPESLRVRCPHCRKLYLVQIQDIQESRPRFECIQCHSRFWLELAQIDFRSEVEGIPLPIREPLPARPRPKSDQAAATEPCPKCFRAVPAQSTECTHCGVVISKYKGAIEDFKESSTLPAHSAKLASLWKAVIANYENRSAHDTFLLACQRDDNLAYAGAQYAQMQMLMPSDETTKSRVQQIQKLGLSLIPNGEGSLSSQRPKSRAWQLPIIVGALLIFVGLWMPTFRNMAGVGAAFLFLSYTLRRMSLRV